jgi:hypothetical protein
MKAILFPFLKKKIIPASTTYNHISLIIQQRKKKLSINAGKIG